MAWGDSNTIMEASNMSSMAIVAETYKCMKIWPPKFEMKHHSLVMPCLSIKPSSADYAWDPDQSYQEGSNDQELVFTAYSPDMIQTISTMAFACLLHQPCIAFHVMILKLSNTLNRESCGSLETSVSRYGTAMISQPCSHMAVPLQPVSSHLPPSFENINQVTEYINIPILYRGTFKFLETWMHACPSHGNKWVP